MDITVPHLPALLARELKSEELTTTDASYNYFLSYLIPESQLKICDYNRVITDLNGLSSKAFLEKISVDFEIENKGTEPYKSSKRREISMYLEGIFYSLSLRATKQKNQSAIDQLDAHILQTHLLEPILGITNVRTNSRIGYIYGADSLEQIKATVDCGNHRVGFGLFPIEVRELMDIADSNAVMPPKSTYIYPKIKKWNHYIRVLSMPIKSNLTKIQSQLPSHVTLVAVSKTKPVNDLMEAYSSGQRIFGENKIQEMVDKHQQMPKDIQWHMIGNVQRNKVKYMASFVDLIHGVDSEKLLNEINKQAEKHQRIINCLLQIKIAQEDTKFGMTAEAAHTTVGFGSF